MGLAIEDLPKHTFPCAKTMQGTGFKLFPTTFPPTWKGCLFTRGQVGPKVSLCFSLSLLPPPVSVFLCPIQLKEVGKIKGRKRKKKKKEEKTRGKKEDWWIPSAGIEPQK